MRRSGLYRNGVRPRSGLRRTHRWAGSLLVVFVLLLASTGIALNHGSDLGLDRRYVDWSWLLDAYGIESPDPAASFAAGGHRATLLGERLYLDDGLVMEDVATLTGLVQLGPLLLATTDRTGLLLTADGEIAEAMDLTVDLPAVVERTGIADDRVVLVSAGQAFRGDDAITVFEPWDGASEGNVAWSLPSRPDADQLRALQAAYRGRGLTVERLLLDLHSGRILALGGTLLMDIVALGLIVLSLTGLVLSVRQGRR